MLLNGFYEWKAAAGSSKQPYYVHLAAKGAAAAGGSSAGGSPAGKGGAAAADGSSPAGKGGGGSSPAGKGGGGSSPASKGGGGGGGAGEEPVMRMAGLWDTWQNAEGEQVRPGAVALACCFLFFYASQSCLYVRAHMYNIDPTTRNHSLTYTHRSTRTRS